MNTRLLKFVRKTYNNPLAPIRTNRHNQRALARAVGMLGDKWVLAQQRVLTRRL